MDDQHGKHPHAIAGIARVSVFFNGVEFPFTRQSLFGFAHMVESSKLAIPMIRLQLTDGIDFLASNPDAMVEGAELRITVTARDTDTYTRLFRVNFLSVSPDKVGNVIDLDGYLNYTKYWIETINSHFIAAPSSEVLRRVSEYTGLKYLGVETSDTQRWSGGLRKIHTFCTDVANHGFRSESSCMKRAVTLKGEFLYRDISVLGDTGISSIFSIGSVEQNKLPVVSYYPRNVGGSPNRRTGYRQTLVEYSTCRPTLYRVHKGMQVSVNEGGDVNINPSIRSSVLKGNQWCAPIDYGNLNDNYHRAFYQNSRGTSLFSVGLDVITPLPTVSNPGLTVFDTVKVEAPQEIQELAGTYIVVSHSILIDVGQYHEKFELTRRSTASNQTRVATRNTARTGYASPGSALSEDF